MARAIARALILADAAAEPLPGALLIDGNRIAGIAHGDDVAALCARAAQVDDAGGALVLPGFVNAHHHSYANALRGTENALPLELWSLFTVAWGRALDAGTLRLAILLGAAEMLRAGYSAVVDHAPHLGLRAAAIAAHRESGMRVAYAPMLQDRHDHDLFGFDLPAALRADIEGQGFATHEAMAAAVDELVAATRGDARVSILLGPNAPQRCSPALLDLVGRLRDAHGLGLHMHLLETRAQAVLERRLWPHGLVHELARRGLLAPGTSLAHGVWAGPDAQDLIARHGATVVHNPASNLMLSSGVMDLVGMARRGVALALGSDSANSGGLAEPFEAMRLARMLARRDQATPPDAAPFAPGARAALLMATEGGAAVLGERGEAGRLAPGYRADLALVRLDAAAMAAMRVSVEALVQYGAASRVVATMVDGVWAYRDGRILAFDEARVLADFAARAEALHARAAAEHGIASAAARALAPQLRALRDPQA